MGLVIFGQGAFVRFLRCHLDKEPDVVDPNTRSWRDVSAASSQRSSRLSFECQN